MNIIELNHFTQAEEQQAIKHCKKKGRSLCIAMGNEPARFSPLQTTGAG